ncbi:MAG: YitT family protein [Porphyromonas sp.]|nr:YitT family protein [Porphyromonas sp.]
MSQASLSSSQTTKPTRQEVSRDILYIIVGSLIQAIGYSVFVAPSEIVPGGIYGITITLNHITKGVFSFMPNGVPIGITALFFNIPLMILAAKKLGLSSGWKTALTFTLISIFTDTTSYLMKQQCLVPEDRILAAVYGGAIIGVGVFIIFQAGGTSAGTDVVARVIANGRNIKLSNAIVVVDSIVVLLGLLAFKDWTVPLYSWLTIFVYGKVVDFFQPENPKRAVFIVSTKTEALHDLLVGELNLRGTIINAKGLYKGRQREIIFLITERKILPLLKSSVLEIDPSAFISTMDASHDPAEVFLDEDA